MKKVELHCKTKYSRDLDSTIDIESVIWNAKENGEKGIVFADKDSIMSFPKIDEIYNKLCIQDETLKKFKIGYGVELTSIIEDKEYEVIVLIKNNGGLFDMYKIMSLYLNNYERKVPIEELLNNDKLLLGLILNEESIKLDLSIFDYLEINGDIDISNIKDKSKLVYSNIPNALFEGELKAKEVLYLHQHIDKVPECRLYKDTEDTLKEYNNKEIVITNSNMLFDNLDKIIINDGKFYTTHINSDEFETVVRNSFKEKYNNPSKETVNRLNEELNLIKELDYSYYYQFLMTITNYCKDNNEYYQLAGYINNSLVAYVLNLTEIEPFNLPYELFFSEIPKLEIKISPKFYYKKMFPYIINKYKDNLIGCNFAFKLSKSNIPRVIKHYEIKTKKELSSQEKDYITDVLNDIPLYRKETLNNSFFIIPDNKKAFDFSAYEYECEFYEYTSSGIMGTHYDYHDLENNLIRLQFILNDDIETLTNIINKTNTKVDLCNDKKVFNLFRNTEEFNCKFNILNKETGTLNIRYFDDKELENKLTNITNIWLDDLIKILMNINHGIIKDDLYNDLKIRGLEEKDIFNVINSLKDSKKLLVSKAFILNKIRISYMQMYYKLYYPKVYYEEILSNIIYKYIDNKVYNYSIEDIKRRYYELDEANKIHLSLEEHEEFELLQILIEMYERKIQFKIKSNKIVIGE